MQTEMYDTLRQILTEERNSLLMKHNLFPDQRLLRQLERYGFKFKSSRKQFGKRMYGIFHRGSQASGRTVQTLIIFKEDVFFREIPKKTWVALVDPEDATSETYGVVYMRKLLQKEKQRREKMANMIDKETVEIVSSE
jgi:hypothetical protein